MKNSGKFVVMRQVNPLYQESHFVCPEGVILAGNRCLKEYSSEEYCAIMENFVPAMCWYNDEIRGIDDDAIRDAELVSLLRDYGFVKSDMTPWSSGELNSWRKLFCEFADVDCLEDASEQEYIILMCLELLTGKPWVSSAIAGCSQSDWQLVYFRDDLFSRNDISVLASMYFNTGSEWQVSGVCDSVEEAMNDYSVGIYYDCSMDMLDIREEIARMCEIPEENVIMYEYAGARPVFERISL